MDSIQRKDLKTEAQNKKSTEIDTLSISQILKLINSEDQSISLKVAAEIDSIEKAVEICVDALRKGCKIFYIGAGTSGRLGVLDASEIPPTFSASPDLFTGIIAGGDKALKKSIEGAEDDKEQAIEDLRSTKINEGDVLIGISTSGAALYVQSALEFAHSINVKTIYLMCNKTPFLAFDADVEIKIDTGPEVITGSTRMKAGTATKMVLNMISTTSMIKLGKVYGNLMVDLMAVNDKLIDRGTRIIMQLTSLGYQDSLKALQSANMSVKVAVVMVKNNCQLEEALESLKREDGNLRKIIQ